MHTQFDAKTVLHLLQLGQYKHNLKYSTDKNLTSELCKNYQKANLKRLRRRDNFPDVSVCLLSCETAIVKVWCHQIAHRENVPVCM